MRLWRRTEVAQKQNLHIRWTIRRDLPLILDIEEQVFDDPLSHSDFVDFLSERNSIGMVAELDHQIVGYVIYKMRSQLNELASIAVDPKYARSGVGTALINKIIRKLNSKRTRIEAFVRERNLPAQQFFRSLNFRANQIIKRPYKSNNEDAYLMVFDKDYKPSDIPQNRIQGTIKND